MPIAAPVGQETITVSNSVATLTASELTAQVTYADVQVQGYQIRVTFDGTDPAAATTGQLWSPGHIARVWGPNMASMEMIREGDNDATVDAHYFGRGAA